MTEPDPRLVKWVRKQLTSDITDEGTINRFELWHAADVEKDKLAVAEVSDGATDADDLVAELWEAAENDSSTRTSGLPQRYVVVSFRGLNERHEINGQHAFILEGGGERARQIAHFGDSFPATDTGERAMGMNQVHSMHKLMFQQTSYLSEVSRQAEERERRLRLKYEEERLKTFELIEGLMDRKHEREIEQAKMLEREKRNEQLMSLFMTMAPLIAARVLGAPTGKGGGAEVARDAGVTEALRSLSEQEVMGMLEALDPPNQIKFIELYSTYKTAHKEKDAAKHPLLRDRSEDDEPKVH